MPEPYHLKPDREFLQSLLDGGGGDLKKCYQCATCSIVCELSSNRAPFPRKEMLRAQWGLKDQLVGDPDIWLCHQCNDCSARCPRGARPADVMAAIRQASIRFFAFPGFVGKWMSNPGYLPFLLGLPALVLGLAVLFFREQAVATSGKIVFPVLLPQWVLITLFSFVGVFSVFVLAAGIVRLWRAMKTADGTGELYSPGTSLLSSILTTFKGILTHDKFNMCEVESSRSVSHFAVFYGFIALFAAGMWAMTARINPLLGEGFVYPFSFFNPWRILGNLGGAALVFGCALMIYERLKDRDHAIASSFSDWFFLGTLLLTGVTGLAAEGLHYVRMEPHRYMVYYIHLVLAFTLLIYLPYSKFAHIVYRTTAMVYAEYSGRGLGEPKTVEPTVKQADDVKKSERVEEVRETEQPESGNNG